MHLAFKTKFNSKGSFDHKFHGDNAASHLSKQVLKWVDSVDYSV